MIRLKVNFAKNKRKGIGSLVVNHTESGNRVSVLGIIEYTFLVFPENLLAH